MPLSRATETVRVDLPVPGEWVEVRRTQSVAARHAVNNLMFSSMTKPGVADAVRAAADGDQVAVMRAASAVDVATWQEAQLVALDYAIAAWSFPEPVTPENIRMLDQASIDAVSAALDELYPPERTDDERKNSSAAGQRRLPAEAAYPMTSAGVS